MQHHEDQSHLHNGESAADHHDDANNQIDQDADHDEHQATSDLDSAATDSTAAKEVQRHLDGSEHLH